MKCMHAFNAGMVGAFRDSRSLQNLVSDLKHCRVNPKTLSCGFVRWPNRGDYSLENCLKEFQQHLRMQGVMTFKVQSSKLSLQKQSSKFVENYFVGVSRVQGCRGVRMFLEYRTSRTGDVFYQLWDVIQLCSRGVFSQSIHFNALQFNQFCWYHVT